MTAHTRIVDNLLSDHTMHLICSLWTYSDSVSWDRLVQYTSSFFWSFRIPSSETCCSCLAIWTARCCFGACWRWCLAVPVSQIRLILTCPRTRKLRWLHEVGAFEALHQEVFLLFYDAQFRLQWPDLNRMLFRLLLLHDRPSSPAELLAGSSCFSSSSIYCSCIRSLCRTRFEYWVSFQIARSNSRTIFQASSIDDENICTKVGFLKNPVKLLIWCMDCWRVHEQIIIIIIKKVANYVIWTKNKVE